MFERAIVDAAGVFEGEDCESGYAECDEQIQAIGWTGRFEGRERYHGRRMMEKSLGVKETQPFVHITHGDTEHGSI